MAFPSLLSDHEQRAFSEFLNQLAQEDNGKPPSDGRRSPLDAAALQQQQQQLQLQLQHHLHLRQLQMQHQQQHQQHPHFSGHGAPPTPGTTLPSPFGASSTPEMDQQHQGIAQQHREWIQMLSANPVLAPGGVIDPHAMSQAFLANPELMAQANAITQAMVLAQQQQMQMQIQRQQHQQHQQQQQQQQHLHPQHHQSLSHAHHHSVPHHPQLPVPPHLMSQQQPHHLSMPPPSHLDQQQYHHGEKAPNANSMGHMSPPGMPPHPTIPSHDTSPGMSFPVSDQDPAMSDSSATSAAAKSKPSSSSSSSSTLVAKRKSKSGSTTNGRTGTSEPAGSSSMGSPSTSPYNAHSEQFSHQQSQEHRDEEAAHHRHMKSSIRKGSSASVSVSERTNGGEYPAGEESGGSGTSLKRKGSVASGPGSAASGQEGNGDESPVSLSGGADMNGTTGASTAMSTTTSTTTTTTATPIKGGKDIATKGGRPGQTAARAKKPHHELLTEAEKKANHIASEQKRRQNIRVGFDSLVEIVPTLSDCHRSEALILQKSVDYIQRLLQQKRELKERVRDLQRHLGDSIDDDDSATEMEVEEHMRP
ncbi:hypothetical protein DFQ26_005780 [Actinomortierella ambigua]|nr:hypothetical protein DFQ26_005780 [Actinomortierella ambigua]